MVRMAAARWWLLLVVGCLGFGAAALAIQLRNDSISPTFEATAVYPVDAEGSSSGRDGGQTQEALRSAVDRAVAANADLLEQGGASITGDQDNFQILFAARARNGETAAQRAEKLRDNYVIAEFGGITAEQRLRLLLSEAIKVSWALDALEPPVPSTTPVETLDPETQARLDFLLIQVNALESESSKLIGNLVLAETGETRNGTVRQVQAQIDSVKQKLAAIYTELETIPGFDFSMLEQSGPQGQSQNGLADPNPATESSAGGQGNGSGDTGGRTEVSVPGEAGEIAPGWKGEALEDRYAELQEEYQALFISNLAGEVAVLASVDVKDVTAQPIRALLGGGAGFAGGLLLGGLALFLFNRIRRPVWVGADLAPFPVLAEIPFINRDPTTRRGLRQVEHHRRGIQELRASVIATLETAHSPLSIGMSGVNTSAAETTALVAEVAGGLGAADRNVLVLDVDFQLPTASAEPMARPNLADILALSRIDPEEARSQLKAVLTEGPEQQPGVRILTAGSLDADPSDVILGRSFDRLVAEVLSQVDLVLTAVPETERGLAAQSLYQRLDGVIAVGRVRTTRVRDVTQLADALADRRARFLGVVLLKGSPTRGPRLRVLTSRRLASWPRAASKRRLQQARGRRKPKAQIAERSTPEAEEPVSSRGYPLTVAAAGFVKSVASPRYLSKVARARVITRMPTSRLRPLPDFLVIGGQRCGTSSLYKYLGQHPSVLPSVRKETEFFSSRYSSGEAWYRAHFSISSDGSDRGPSDRRYAFEADPSYLLDPRAPRRVYELLPDAKLVVLLRNPVDRATSHYFHNRRLGQEKASLEQALDLESDRLNGELDRMSAEPYYPGRAYQLYSYVTRGIYVDQLNGWLEFFPAERIMAIHSMDLLKEAPRVYKELLEFLGIPQWLPPSLRNYSSSVNGSGREIEPNTRKRLASVFAPHNQRLYELLGRDFGWQ